MMIMDTLSSAASEEEKEMVDDAPANELDPRVGGVNATMRLDKAIS